MDSSNFDHDKKVNWDKWINFIARKPLLGGTAVLGFVVMLIIAAATLAQSSSITLVGNESLDVYCDGSGFRLSRISRTEVNLFCQAGPGGGEPTPEPTDVPPQPTDVPPEPTDVPPEPTDVPPEPTDVPPQPTAEPPTGDPIQPYVDAPACEEIGVPHDDRAWHGIWNYDFGCHWNHEHHDNPRTGDALFGTEFYAWAGGEISYPWQTFAGADNLYILNEGNPDPTSWNFPPSPSDPAKFENGAKHNVYFWRVDLGEEGCTSGDYALSTHCLESFRLQAHGSGNHIGAVTTFHSMYIQGLAQTLNNDCDNTQGAYLADGSLNPNACFGSVGGWIDFGRLRVKGMPQNDPNSRLVLPGDNPAYDDLPIQLRPYRSHPCTGSGCVPGDSGASVLHSWNASGNYLVPDFAQGPRLYFGYGFHIDDGWGPIDTDAPDIKAGTGVDVLTCGMDFENCEYNSSRMGVFRAYIGVPVEFDGSVYDQDGQANGFVTMRGYATRYGDVVAYETAAGEMVGSCTAPGLDCVPFVFSNFPTDEAGYRGNIIQHSPEPGIRTSDMTEYDVYFCSDGEVCSPTLPDGRKNRDASPSGWIRFPN